MSPHAIRHSSIVNIIHPAFNTADQKRFTLTDLLSCGSNGKKTYSLYLYDVATGGAGYVSQTAAHLLDLLRTARDLLANCPKKCDVACQICLLTHDTQHHIDDLNRHNALTLFSEEFIAALAH